MPTAFAEIIAARGKGMPADGEVTITGSDPVYSTKFKIGETVAAVLGGDKPEWLDAGGARARAAE